MINKRKRTDAHPDLDAAKEATQTVETSTFTTYAPLADIDALNLIALKKRVSVSALMRDIIKDYLAGQK